MSYQRVPLSKEQNNYNLIGSRLSVMRSEMFFAMNRRPKHITSEVMPIIVTKDVHPEVIERAYFLGQRHFGECDINDLITKSNCGVIREYCPDINWHFIGSLQAPRIGRLVTSVYNLHMIQTIERAVDGDILESALRRINSYDLVNVAVQVNTSRESGATGVKPEDADRLVHHLLVLCPHLRVKALMTVGSTKADQKADFITLTHLREVLQKQFGITLSLIMGWTKDFKQAIRLGSTYFRMEERVFTAAMRGRDAL